MLRQEDVVLKVEMPEIGKPRRGKVRDIYDLGDKLLMIATDRISAFDVVLPNGIPGKGKVLTAISLFWFKEMEEIISNHIITAQVEEFPEEVKRYGDLLRGRSTLVKKAIPFPVECIVRGYLSGSGWKEYREKGSICGIRLPEGLVESSRLEQPIFTPSTKATEGHDINISFDEMIEILGKKKAEKLRDLSLLIYLRARDIAEKKGIIIADTKFEFGQLNGNIILIDELLTPDSSRFWSLKDYRVGQGQDSYDKQIVRDYLLTLDWDKRPPGPHLPDEIIKKTSDRYKQILRLLTG